MLAYIPYMDIHGSYGLWREENPFLRWEAAAFRRSTISTFILRHTQHICIKCCRHVLFRDCLMKFVYVKPRRNHPQKIMGGTLSSPSGFYGIFFQKNDGTCAQLQDETRPNWSIHRRESDESCLIAHRKTDRWKTYVDQWHWSVCASDIGDPNRNHQFLSVSSGFLAWGFPYMDVPQNSWVVCKGKSDEHSQSPKNPWEFPKPAMQWYRYTMFHYGYSIYIYICHIPYISSTILPWYRYPIYQTQKKHGNSSLSVLSAPHVCHGQTLTPFMLTIPLQGIHATDIYRFLWSDDRPTIMLSHPAFESYSCVCLVASIPLKSVWKCMSSSVRMMIPNGKKVVQMFQAV